MNDLNQYIGIDADFVKKSLEFSMEFSNFNIHIIPEDSIITNDLIQNRIRIITNKFNIVKNITIG